MLAQLRKRFPRLVIPWEDRARYSPRVHALAARFLARRALGLSARRDPAAKLVALTRAYQAAWDGDLLEQLRAQLALSLPPMASEKSDFGVEPWNRLKIGWKRYQRPGEPTRLSRSVILKAPDERTGERGVLFLQFEYNWLRLLCGVGNFAEFAERFTVVYGTSWSPTDYNMVALALEQTPAPANVFFQTNNLGEIPKLEGFHPRAQCLTTQACDWIEPAFYEPLPMAERPYDILFLANWAPFKRHWQFFQALSRMRPDLRVLLIGQKEGGHTQEDIRRLAKSFGVRQELEIRESIPVEEVSRLQCSAKVAVNFSAREGSCVAIVESLHAGSPISLLERGHVGARAHVNPRTGILLRPERAAAQLTQLLEEAERYEPRTWAGEHVSCHSSIRKLNSQLRAAALEEGRPWTRDCIMPCWRPHLTIMHNPAHGTLRPVYQELHERFPEVFAPDLMEVSHR
jgi:glycosyltransferase involved in cell wall biosynthesis